MAGAFPRAEQQLGVVGSPSAVDRLRARERGRAGRTRAMTVRPRDLAAAGRGVGAAGGFNGSDIGKPSSSNRPRKAQPYPEHTGSLGKRSDGQPKSLGTTLQQLADPDYGATPQIAAEATRR